MHVPARAGAGEPGEPDPRGREALADVAGDVDADQVERDALGARAAQVGQPVAHLLEAGPEAVAQQLDVVAFGPGRLVERPVRHGDRGGEVVGQRHPRQRPRVLGGQLLIAGQPVQDVATGRSGPPGGPAGSCGCPGATPRSAAAAWPRRRSGAWPRPSRPPAPRAARCRAAGAGGGPCPRTARRPPARASRHSRSAASSSSGKWFSWRWMKSLTSSDGSRSAARSAFSAPASSCAVRLTTVCRAPW